MVGAANSSYCFIHFVVLYFVVLATITVGAERNEKVHVAEFGNEEGHGTSEFIGENQDGIIALHE